jgi:hypothetical protein
MGMTEREELIVEIAELEARRTAFAHLAFLLEQRCRGLRDDNPRDYRIAELSTQIDVLDKQYDRDGAAVGRKRLRLREIEIEEGYIGLDEFVADAAYGRSL